MPQVVLSTLWKNGNAIESFGRILVLYLLIAASQPAQAQSEVQAHPGTTASPLHTILEEAGRQELANHPTWLKLLHFERNQSTSSVLPDSFFLDQNGRQDAAAELTATLRAWFEPSPRDPNQMARCRFPARYYWLSHHLALPGYEFRRPECGELEKWALLDRMDSISLLLVSGYLGNPASSFGHVLLRLNTDAPDEISGLMDLTVGFGALVPQFENPIMYIVRGLGGTYEAGFSDKYFYTQDLVYSRSEFRDIWEYQLNLTDYQRNLLQLHIWEIVGHKFQYFFLAKNCAFRIAELLELVLDEEILAGAGSWYIPVTMFHRLEEIDQERRDVGQAGVVDQVRFLPSDRRKLYNEMQGLTEPELASLNSIMRTGVDSLEVRLQGADSEERTRILDALISYQKYRLIADRPDSSSAAWRDRDQVLLKRLALPPSTNVVSAISPLASPAAGFRPAARTVSGAIEKGGRSYGRLGWSPYRKESVGRNSLEGSELVVFDTIVGFGEGKPYVFLDRFDLLRITSLNTSRVKLEGERRASWNLRLGMERSPRHRRTNLDGVAMFGAGRAFLVRKNASVFVMMDGELHTEWPHLRAVPKAGLVWRGPSWGLRLAYGAESTGYPAAFRRRLDARLLYQLGNQHSIQVQHSADLGGLTTVGISRYY